MESQIKNNFIPEGPEKNLNSNLFVPNNHSKHEIGWNPVFESYQEQIRNVLSEGYDLKDIQEMRQVDEWEKMSNNFRIKIGGTDSIQEYLLRKHIFENTLEAIENINKITDFLRLQNIPVPKTILAQDGKKFFIAGDSFWQLFEFIAGSHFKGDRNELESAARGIAKLHKALAILPVNIVSSQRKFPWNVEQIKLIVNTAQNQAGPLNELITAWASIILDNVRLQEDLYNRAVDCIRQPIHHDLHPLNTIFNDGQLKAIIDFGDVRNDFRAMDVGNALHRFVRQYVVHEARPWQQTLPLGINIFIDNYQRINPLTRSELTLMPDFIIDELLGKFRFIVSGEFFQPDIRLAEVKKILTLMEETREIKKYLS